MRRVCHIRGTTQIATTGKVATLSESNNSYALTQHLRESLLAAPHSARRAAFKASGSEGISTWDATVGLHQPPTLCGFCPVPSSSQPLFLFNCSYYSTPPHGLSREILKKSRNFFSHGALNSIHFKTMCLFFNFLFIYPGERGRHKRTFYTHRSPHSPKVRSSLPLASSTLHQCQQNFLVGFYKNVSISAFPIDTMLQK